VGRASRRADGSLLGRSEGCGCVLIMNTHTDVSVAVQNTGEEVRRLKDTLLECLRVVLAACPARECQDVSIPARTLDSMSLVISALESNVILDELLPLVLRLNSFLHIRDNRIIYCLERDGMVPLGIEELTSGTLKELIHYLCPVRQRPESLWKRIGRKLWRFILWLNGE
jgi:hypothetical protein